MNTVLYEINCLEEKMDLVKRFLKQYFRSKPSGEGVVDYGNYGDKRVKRFVQYVYGYLCFYYQNNSDLYGIIEKVRMESLYGLKITAPFSDNFDFDVNVKGMSDFMVVYTTTLEGQVRHHYKHTSWSCLYPDCPEDVIKRLIVSKTKKVTRRKLNNQEIDILVYTFAFSGGYCFYYTNKSKFNYRERLGIDLFNLIGFDNNEQTYFEIILRPGEEYLLKFKVKDLVHPFSYKTRVTYKLYEPNSNMKAMQQGSHNKGLNSFNANNMPNSQNNQRGSPNTGGHAQNGYNQRGPHNNDEDDEDDSGDYDDDDDDESEEAGDFTHASNAYNNKNPGYNEQNKNNIGTGQMPRAVNDMMSYQMNNYGSGGSPQPQPQPQQKANNPNPSSIPKSVNDMMSHQMNTYGSGGSPQPQLQPQQKANNPNPGSMPKSANDMMSYQMNKYGGSGGGAPQPGGGRNNPNTSAVPKAVNDMMSHQINSYGNPGVKNQNVVPKNLPKPANDGTSQQKNNNSENRMVKPLEYNYSQLPNK